MGDMVSVPAEKITALREALDDYRAVDPASTSIVLAVATEKIEFYARAVVDAVATEAAPDELTALRETLARVEEVHDAFEGKERMTAEFWFAKNLRAAIDGTEPPIAWAGDA